MEKFEINKLKRNIADISIAIVVVVIILKLADLLVDWSSGIIWFVFNMILTYFQL
jgi:hypothetical protein